MIPAAEEGILAAGKFSNLKVAIGMLHQK